MVLLVALLCISSRAQGTNIYGMLSPKLRQFVASHPELSSSFSNVLSETFSNRAVQLYYYYTDDESMPRASHYYVSKSSVVIGIRENQQTSDQYICLVFEMLNSNGEKQFYSLTEKAQSGKISRTDFAKGMLRQEFQAVKKVQKLLRDLEHSKTVFSESEYYKGFMECPDTFEGFLNYTTSAISERNEVKQYEQLYDSMRHTAAAGSVQSIVNAH
ncbi:MAG TPA: hypothetical protein VGY98_17100 [Verrucomicrobiae bacterium]|nr:hypothetical protein [Verrucomicrobiae bacterium]